MKRIHLILLAFLFSCLVACRENEDTVIPEVVFHEPQANENIMLPDTLYVDVTVTDDKNINSISVNILNADHIPVVTGQNYFPDMTEYQVKTSFVLDDKAMESGTYQLQVIAFDGYNTKTSYLDLEITEIPRELLGFIAVTAPQSFLSKITRLTPEYDIDTQFTIQQACRMTAIHSLWERFLFVSDEPSVMMAYNTFSFEPEWQFDAVPPRPEITDLVTDAQILFATANADAGILDIDGNGVMRTMAFANMVFTHLAADETCIYVSQQSVGAKNPELTVFYRVTGAVCARKMIADPIAGIVAMNGIALVFVGKDGGTDILRFNPENFILNKINELPGEEFVSLTKIDEENVLILTTQRAVNYNNYYDRFDEFTAEVYDFCRYVALSDVLYFVRGHSVFAYSHDTGALVNEMVFDDTIVDFQILYNK